MNVLLSHEHRILVAMPNQQGSWFEKTVIYIIEDNEHGSMGLVLNLPHEFNIAKLLLHFNLEVQNTNKNLLNQQVLIGGPIEMEHGFILHSPAQNWEKSLGLQNDLAMTVSEDLLQAIAKGEGPERLITCLGFAGWEKGQLAQEMQTSSWLSLPYDPKLVFETPSHDKWRVALNSLGIQPEFLSTEAGHG